jgi:hypothetical protein
MPRDRGIQALDIETEVATGDLFHVPDEIEWPIPEVCVRRTGSLCA